MKLYYAPMEGIVHHVYRTAHAQCFGGIDKYFAPFIVADQTQGFMEKDRNDILPENNTAYQLIPQILTNNAADFLNTAKKIAAFGYDEINLNLGCPSKTVVSGGRGSGFLSDVDGLRRFMEAIFASPPVRISVKTRIGRYSAEEFEALLDIYNDYPLTELIIHPRIQTDMYLNTPNQGVFSMALENKKHATVYNGDVRGLLDYDWVQGTYGSQISAVMIGRGLLANPALSDMIAGRPEAYTLEAFERFHNHLLEGQLNFLKMPHKVLAKMKEAWHYLFMSLEAPKVLYVAIRQSQDMAGYQSAVATLFKEAQLVPQERITGLRDTQHP